MKRFRFQLEPVLGYKLQVLDAQMIELGSIQARVRQQETRREEAYDRLAAHNAEYVEKSREGISPGEAMGYQMSLEVLKNRAEHEDEVLSALRAEEEAKRQAVIETRKDTHSLEKLKELRQSEYNHAVEKAEEKALDDLTAAKRAAEAREIAMQT